MQECDKFDRQKHGGSSRFPSSSSAITNGWAGTFWQVVCAERDNNAAAKRDDGLLANSIDCLLSGFFLLVFCAIVGAKHQWPPSQTFLSVCLS